MENVLLDKHNNFGGAIVIFIELPSIFADGHVFYPTGSIYIHDIQDFSNIFCIRIFNADFLVALESSKLVCALSQKEAPRNFPDLNNC